MTPIERLKNTIKDFRAYEGSFWTEQVISEQDLQDLRYLIDELDRIAAAVEGLT